LKVKMIPSISHGRGAETLRAKTLWFQSLTLEERMEYLCSMTDLILENTPQVVERKHAEPVAGRIRVVRSPRV
jgi:NADH:ubiquinone oxidoreductase subunit D